MNNSGNAHESRYDPGDVDPYQDPINKPHYGYLQVHELPHAVSGDHTVIIDPRQQRLEWKQRSERAAEPALQPAAEASQGAPVVSKVGQSAVDATVSKPKVELSGAQKTRNGRAWEAEQQRRRALNEWN